MRRPVKHEYGAGQIFAMVGVSRDHNRIALNLFKLLEAHLYGGPCQIYVAEVKVRVEKADAFYYPDIAVTCDASDTEKYYLTHPCLIVEVLSPSTEGIDRREKLMAYQQLESLQEYILYLRRKRGSTSTGRMKKGNGGSIPMPKKKNSSWIVWVSRSRWTPSMRM